MSILTDALQAADSIAIVGHIRPDGDCVGSCLGLWNYLTEHYPEKETQVYLEPPADKFRYLNLFDRICSEAADEKTYDLFIGMDSGAADRFGTFSVYFETAGKSICVDHHKTNTQYADIQIVEPEASSTCEVLYGLLEEEKIGLETAKCLYTGIVHDTGVFKYSCTSSKTMLIAGKLMERGINTTDIIDGSFYRRTYIQNQVLGRVLMESMLFMDGLCIVGSMKLKDMDFFGVSGTDMDGIIDQLRLTNGVECAIFAYETEPHIYKVSLRSNNIVDVSKVAEFFGGGGHVRAAGCNMSGSMHDVVNNISPHIEKQLQEQGYV